MRDKTVNPLEERFKLVGSLLINGKPQEAKRLTDELHREGVPVPIICHSCYDSFRYLVLHNMEKAREAADLFRDYGFNHWLNI